MSSSSFFVRRRRPLYWLLGLFTTYTALGFLFLPWIVERQLNSTLQSRLELTSSVQEIRFNPFTFVFAVNDLQIDNADGSPLFRMAELRLNFQASQLALLKFQFAEIVIAEVDLYFERSTASENTVTVLARAWADTAEIAPQAQADETEQEGSLPPIEILALSLSALNLHIVDSVPQTEFSTTLTLAEASVEQFSTLPDQAGSNRLRLQLEQDASLEWQGGFSLNPMRFEGDIALENFSLGTASRYLQDSLPFTLEDGRIALAVDYLVDLSGEEMSIGLNDIALELSNLSAQQNGASDPFITLPGLVASGGSIRYPQNEVDFAGLEISDLDFYLTRGADGLTNIEAMLATLPQTQVDSEQTVQVATEDSNPWQLAVELIQLEDNRLNFSDLSVVEPVNLVISSSVSLEDVNNAEASRFPLAASLLLSSGGEFSLDGFLQVLPNVDLSADIDLSELSLLPAQAYVSDFAQVQILSGSVSLAAAIASNSADLFSYRGGFSVDDLAIADQLREESLITLGSLAVDTADFSLARNNLDISELSVDELFARVIINEDGSTNLARVMVPTESVAEQSTAEQTATSSLFEITLGQLSINNGSANFTDRNLPIVFNTYIESLSGTAQGFATNTSEPTAIALEGQVDDFGLVQIDASLNPFDFLSQSELALKFTNIDMPGMTPYTVKFAGREIEEGAVDVDLGYNVQEGQLVANNIVVLKNLSLGERVEHEGAMDLPLDLALALLKDRDGHINLEIPVSGDVNDPQFDLGPVIRESISNIFANIISAPFRLLGGLVGGDSDNLDNVKFLPGRADITSPEQQTLLTLAEALEQRPELLLEIATLQSPADILPLQVAAVDARINAALEENADAEASLTNRRQQVLERLYVAAGVSPSLSEMQALHQQPVATETPIPEPATNAEVPADVAPSEAITTRLDVQAYSADLQESLVRNEQISTDRLMSLASARQQAVIDFIGENTSVDPARLLRGESEVSEPDEDGWLSLTFSLTGGR